MHELGAYRAYIVIVPGRLRSPEEIRRLRKHATQEERDRDEADYDPNGDIDNRRHVCSCQVCKEGSFTSRWKDMFVFPVSDPIGLVKLYRTGTQTITSFLVFSSNAKPGHDKKCIRDDIKSMLNDDVLPWTMDHCTYGTSWLHFHPSKQTHQVTVDRSLFAVPRNEKLVWWATLWTNAPADECDLRKRYLLAFSAQAIIVGIWIVLRALYGLIAASYLFFIHGWRHTTLKPIVHPFDMDIWGETPSDLLTSSDLAGLTREQREDKHGSFIKYDSQGNRRGVIGAFLHTPLTWISLSGLGYIWMKYPKMISLVIVAIILIANAIFVAVKLGNLTSRAIQRRIEEAKKRSLDPTVIQQRLTLAQAAIQPTQTHQHINLGTRALVASTKFRARVCLPFADD